MAEREVREWRVERVVCAVDLSAGSEEALRQADELARLHEAALARRGGSAELVVEERLPAELILELARTGSASLICMGTTGAPD